MIQFVIQSNAWRHRRLLAVLVLAALTLGVVAPVGASVRSGRTERISSTPGGEQPDHYSWLGSVSADGRWVAFLSKATNLGVSDTNQCRTYEGLLESCTDVYVRNRATGAITRVSVASDGTEGNWESSSVSSPAISGNGRFVAFRSSATNLTRVSGGPDARWQIYVHDRDADENGTFDEPGGISTEMVSVNDSGEPANRDADHPSISADGQHVMFTSFATNLASETSTTTRDVFVHDRAAAKTARVSESLDRKPMAEPPGGSAGGGLTANATPLQTISADGRFVVFGSNAGNLAPDNSNRDHDIYVRDRDADEDGVFDEPGAVTARRVNIASDGTPAEPYSRSYGGVISGNGRFVVFQSNAKVLVPAWTSNHNLYMHDRDADENGVFDEGGGIATEVVSISSSGRRANEPIVSLWASAVSDDGRYVTFGSGRNHLVPDDANSKADVFVHDRLLGVTELVSVGNDGTQGDAGSFGNLFSGPGMSGDGRIVTFYGASSTLTPNTTSEFFDVFARDRGPAAGVARLAAARQEGSLHLSGWATFAGKLLALVDGAKGNGAPGANELGADLTRASLAYRAGLDDVLVRINVAEIPKLALDSPWRVNEDAPAPFYVVEFTVDDVRFEIRAAVSDQSAIYGDGAAFGLFRCEPACVPVGSLEGSVGITGNEVLRVAVPLDVVGAAPGDTLRSVRVVSTLAPEPRAALDEIVVGDVAVPEVALAAAVAPAGTAESDIPFQVPLDLLDHGELAGSIDVNDLPAGQYDVWARGCLGSLCGATSTPITIGGGA